MKTVHEVSEISGVSIRALHHYDAIGLLKPTEITSAGYRLYDDAAIARLQTILLFKELEFPLSDIKRILDSPEFDEKEALKQQIELLKLRRKQIDKLIKLAAEITKGGHKMDFQAFDKTEQEAYRKEAKKRWGDTAAWKEYEQKGTASGADGMMAIFAELGRMKDISPADKAAQLLVKKLQEHISKNYYNCTDEILSELGKMYVADERFKNHIDKVGGNGTAEFAAKAIAFYTSEK